MNCDVGEVTERSQLILQPFGRFTYLTGHSPSLPMLHLRHSSFSKPSVSLPTSQLILQAFRLFTYITAHSPSLPSLYLHHSSFSNTSVALPTSQLILQAFRCFTYVTAHFSTLLSLLLRDWLFTYVTWRATHDSLSVAGAKGTALVYLINIIVTCVISGHSMISLHFRHLYCGMRDNYNAKVREIC